MKSGQNTLEKGAVLIVALIMLAMVTFLVVAFVGFARFERASVTSSLKRTEVSFLSGGSQSIALSSAINSAYLDGNGTAYLTVSRRSSTNDFVPVYIDTTGDGRQDANQSYLNLNSEVNNPAGIDPDLQVSGPSILTVGDPQWIGLAENPEEPHGPENRFVARIAYMTVPVSEILNVRYNHQFDSSDLISHNRGQGGSARSIDLAAPLFQMHPELFSLAQYNPYKYAGGMHELGAAVGDAYHYGRPSLGFKQVRIENKTTPPVARAHQAADAILGANDLTGGFGSTLNTWFRTTGGGQKPYGFYKFMGTFSAAELPEEKGGFDISSIRDESTSGYGYSVKLDPYGGSAVRFLQPHGLHDGDKVELDGLPPHIVDPISFDLISPEDDPIDIKKRLVWLIQGGSFTTPVAHRLQPGDSVKLLITDYSSETGLDPRWRILVKANPSAPWTAISSTPVDAPSYPTTYLRNISSPLMPGKKAFTRWVTHPSSLLNSPSSGLHQFSFGVLDEDKIQISYRKQPGAEYAWGVYDTALGAWVPRLRDVTDDLPAELENLTCQLVYRPEALLADYIPYFVKGWDEKTVSLHRSARLDDQSRVRFINEPGSIPLISEGARSFNSIDSFNYDATTGMFITSSPRWLTGDYVRFKSPAKSSLTGVGIEFDQVFRMELVGASPPDLRFILRYPTDNSFYPGSPLKLTDSGMYQLQLVHKIKVDRLTASVEKMAGAMLDESLDVEDNGTAQIIKLGGESLPIPDSANPFPLVYGIGGHQDAMGPWHNAKGGIPWESMGFNGSYTHEMERILQVAANIGDIYSGAPRTEVKGRDVLKCSPSDTYWAFGEAAPDGRVSAEIRYNYISLSKGRPAGLDYGPYRVFFDPSRDVMTGSPIIGYGFVQGTIKLMKAAKLIAESAPCKVKFLSPPTSGGSWKWSLKELVWKNGASKAQLSWVALNLAVEMESGRFVKVYLDGKEVLNYASPLRVGPELGTDVWITRSSSGELKQAALWAEAQDNPPDPDNDVYFFTLIHPAVPVPGATPPPGWTVDWAASSPSSLPTAYQGVFSRDKKSNTYLSGLQRKTSFAVNAAGTSWYQRGAPKILGVKDRPGSYAGRMPAINEVSLRLTYNRPNDRVTGRLALEVNMPPAGLLPTPNQLVITDLVVRGNGVPEYRDLNGLNPEDGALFPVTVSGVAGGIINLNSGPGDSAAVLASGPLGTGGIARVIPGPTPGSKMSLADIRFSDIEVQFKAQVLAGGRVVDFFDGTLALPSASLGNPMTNHELFAPVWDAVSAAGYASGQVVLDPVSHNYYRLLPGGAGTVKPPKPAHWLLLDKFKYRKIDLSSQVNDPLVNGSERGWQPRAYSPTYISGSNLVPNNNETKVLWSPFADPSIPLNKMFAATTFATAFSAPARHIFGVNLCERNDAWQPWGRTSTGGKNDLRIKDPGILIDGWWKFPDVMRGGVKNIGWLGQVHRGTPWQTLYLKSQSDPGPDWDIWAGSSDTKPVNDRRLIEAFYISDGNKVRGRLSVNNPTSNAWSGVLHGVDLPYINPASPPPTPLRILGGHDGHTNRGNRDIETHKGAADTRWNSGVLGGIANQRRAGKFKRVTDILAAPQLTDQSPYLPEMLGVGNLSEYYAWSGKVDELDIERIPQQILSLLKAGGPQHYQTYIFTQQLRPARRYHLPGTSGKPGVREDGMVENYEVVSQSAERVLVELVGAEEWHESFKRGHYGKYRDAGGSLKDLPRLYPKIISKYPIDMGY